MTKNRSGVRDTDVKRFKFSIGGKPGNTHGMNRLVSSYNQPMRASLFEKINKKINNPPQRIRD